MTCLLAAAMLPTFFTAAKAQDLRWLKREIRSLCAPAMAGRGYVQKGQERAAQHIMHRFRDAGLKALLSDSGYYQRYTFPVVTFPDSVMLRVNRNDLQPGVDFLVDAASDSYRASRQKVKTVDVGHLPDAAAWTALRARLSPGRVWVLKGTDSLARLLQIRPHQLAQALPHGAFIILVHGKMTWTVATAPDSGTTVLYVQDSVLPRHLRRASIFIHSRLEPAAKCTNVVAMVPGTAVPDSFIAFAAHYDHLGKMGWDATFPGASDNASGTACIEWLAAHFAQQPQRYSMLFIAFSGEEAGLKGSRYFVEHPPLPLDRIRFLINLDIMGNAQDGVTVVNATERPAEFLLLQSLNKKGGYLPEVRSRGKAANSDHYFFSEAGVPAFFLYSNGGPGFYHDVFDKPDTLALTNVDEVLKLLMDFVAAIQ